MPICVLQKNRHVVSEVLGPGAACHYGAACRYALQGVSYNNATNTLVGTPNGTTSFPNTTVCTETCTVTGQTCENQRYAAGAKAMAAAPELALVLVAAPLWPPLRVTSPRGGRASCSSVTWRTAPAFLLAVPAP